MLILLAVWALAMGMQSAAIRWLEVGGVFTTAATATFIFLAGSFARRPLTGEERYRLSGVLASLVIGGTAGAMRVWFLRLYRNKGFACMSSHSGRRTAITRWARK